MSALAGLESFGEVWALDFEFHAPPGERPEPICMVAIEVRSGHVVRWWLDAFNLPSQPPFATGDDVLVVCYYASAEFGYFLALDWSMPAHVLDLFAEFRCQTNGLPVPCGNGLIGALAYHGLDAIGANEKEDLRQLAISGGPFTDAERAALLNYCESDVLALVKLLPEMLPKIDLPRALLRGRYTIAAARIEWSGTPIDVETLGGLRSNWSTIQSRLVMEVDRDYGVYVPRGRREINSQSEYGRAILQTAREWKIDAYELRDVAEDLWKDAKESHASEDAALDGLLVDFVGNGRRASFTRKVQLADDHDSIVGFDALTEMALWDYPEALSSGYENPADALFCRLKEGRRRKPLKQEFGIAAKLSGDAAMIEAYSCGDPYLAFAKQAGAVPADATKKTHAKERGLFKTCALAVQYGMGSKSLAQSLGEPEALARQLLKLHRETYSTFWKWSDDAESHAMLHGHLWTVFGWRVHLGGRVNPRSLRNFPMQANGAEMLRLACIMATERGIQVCAPIHDALLVEGPVDQIAQVVADTQEAMLDASRAVLNGFELRTDAEIVRYPSSLIYYVY